jgi:gas vesicle protein
MIDGLIEGQPIKELVKYARGRLKSKSQELLDSMNETLGERYRFLLQKIQNHIRNLEKEIQETDDYLFASMTPYAEQ